MSSSWQVMPTIAHPFVGDGGFDAVVVVVCVACDGIVLVVGCVACDGVVLAAGGVGCEVVDGGRETDLGATREDGTERGVDALARASAPGVVREVCAASPLPVDA